MGRQDFGTGHPENPNRLDSLQRRAIPLLEMRRTTLAVALVISTALFGGYAAVFLAHHPYLTTADLGVDTPDAKASFRDCRLYASWPLELKQGEHLILERRICPNGFHKDEDDQGWLGDPVQHEVLLLESRNWWHTTIVSALFSDLDFTTVDVGKAADGSDAVIWSYFIKCGSCHGGPNGVLVWSPKTNSYEWNKNWFDPFSSVVTSKLPSGDYPDSPASLAWENLNRQLSYDKPVYGPGDAHCCPSAGNIVGDFSIKGGSLVLDDGFTFVRRQ